MYGSSSQEKKKEVCLEQVGSHAALFQSRMRSTDYIIHTRDVLSDQAGKEPIKWRIIQRSILSLFSVFASVLLGPAWIILLHVMCVVMIMTAPAQLPLQNLRHELKKQSRPSLYRFCAVIVLHVTIVPHFSATVEGILRDKSGRSTAGLLNVWITGNFPVESKP